MKILKRLAALVTLSAAVQGVAAAPVTWGGNGHEYDVVRAEGMTWTAAQAAVAAMGAGWHLATITSAAEDAFVASLLSSALPARSHFWLGATDVGAEGTFEWVTSEGFTYTNWWGGEPNNAGNEDYVAFDLRSGSWGWNDAPDNVGAIFGFARGYIIERSGTAVPEPGTVALLSLGLLGIAAIRRRRP